MISLQNSPKGFLWGNINRVHRRELPWVTAESIRSSRQSGRNTTLVSFDTADFTGLLLWITGLTLYTEISSPEHYVRRAVNHLNAVATWHKLNPEPKWTLILSWQVLYFAGGLHHNVRVLSFTSGTLKFELMYYLLFCSHCVRLRAGSPAWMTYEAQQVKGKVCNTVFIIHPQSRACEGLITPANR